MNSLPANCPYFFLVLIKIFVRFYITSLESEKDFRINKKVTLKPTLPIVLPISVSLDIICSNRCSKGYNTSLKLSKDIQTEHRYSTVLSKIIDFKLNFRTILEKKIGFVDVRSFFDPSKNIFVLQIFCSLFFRWLENIIW